MRIQVESSPFDSSYRVRIMGGADSSEFYDCIALLKETILRRDREYDPQARVWIIEPCREFDAWLRQCESLFEAEIIGYHKHQARNGSRQPSAPPFDPMANAYKTLHLLPSAPLEVVQSVRRALARLHHPDRGGDAERMKQINHAADVIERQLRGAA